MARSGSQSAEEVDRFTRIGNLVAGIAFVLAYLILLTDAKARAEMWPWVVSTGACLGAIVWDERRLREDRLALAFPASRTMHVIAFGPIAVWMHFLRTRWTSGRLRAIGVSILAGLAVTIPQLAVSMIASAEETVADLPETLVALAIAPLPLVLLWRLLAWIDAVLDLQRAFVALAVVLVFGSAIGIGIVLHT